MANQASQTNQKVIWVTAAQLLRPQGRRGELLAEPHGSLDIFTAGRQLWLASREGATPDASAERTVEQAWEPTGKNAGRVVLKLAGVDSISDAEALAGQFVLIRSSDLPPLDEDTFRVRDLIGCSLFDGETLTGTVADVQFPIAADGRTRLEDAPDLLAIQPAGADDAAEPVLIPFVRAWLVDVDIAAKRILMNLPPGFFTEPETLGTDTQDSETQGED